MNSYINYLNDLTNKSNSLYPEYKDQIRWVKYYDALEKENEKKILLENIENKLHWSFKNKKKI